MKSFIVHDGEWIIRVGQCRDADFDQQANEGQFVLEGEADPVNNKIEDGQVVAYTPPAVDPSIELRQDRDALLKESDWSQLTDAPLTDAQKTQWQTYRQALRDLPEHVKWPNLEADDWPQVGA